MPPRGARKGVVVFVAGGAKTKSPGGAPAGEAPAAAAADPSEPFARGRGVGAILPGPCVVLLEVVDQSFRRNRCFPLRRERFTHDSGNSRFSLAIRELRRRKGKFEAYGKP
jgi:hypothetical protein